MPYRAVGPAAANDLVSRRLDLGVVGQQAEHDGLGQDMPCHLGAFYLAAGSPEQSKECPDGFPHSCANSGPDDGVAY